jgi:hypothetical protein
MSSAIVVAARPSENNRRHVNPKMMGSTFEVRASKTAFFMFYADYGGSGSISITFGADKWFEKISPTNGFRWLPMASNTYRPPSRKEGCRRRETSVLFRKKVDRFFTADQFFVTPGS